MRPRGGCCGGGSASGQRWFVVLLGAVLAVLFWRSRHQNDIHTALVDEQSSGNVVVSPLLPDVTATTPSPVPKPRPANCGATYKTDRQVMLDHDCYPPTALYPPSYPRTIAQCLPRVNIQNFTTQTWKSRFITWEDYQPYRAEPAVLKSFDDVVVYHADVSVYFKGPEVWSASYRCNPDKVTPAMQPPNSVSLELEEAVLSASQIWGYGYFHLTFEKVFPIGAARSVLENRPHVKILVETNYPQVTEFFRLMGISADRIQAIGNPVRVKKMHTTYHSMCGWISPQNMQLTRKWLRDYSKHLYEGKNGTRIVMIDRVENGRCNRCITNTQEVVDLLKQTFPERQVDRYVAGDRSVTQVMEDLSAVEILIAPHGAGLANLIFLPDNAKVIEIQNRPLFFHPAFLELCSGLDLGYRAISPRQLSETSVDWSSVDPQNVLKYVRELLQLKL